MNKRSIYNNKRLILIIGLSLLMLVASLPLALAQAASPAPVGIVDAGNEHACALTPSGEVDCWGSNSSGQATDQPGPYTQVSAGGWHTCALTPSGAVDCWGDNTRGQAEDQPGPYTQVSTGNYHTCALTPSGAVDCWGDNTQGQATDQLGPYTQISAGGFQTCALLPSGAVDCWGWAYGQAVDQPGPYIQVSTGYNYACALTPSGAVDCWGDNPSGQATDQPGPYTQVSAGGFHTCALNLSGEMYCWGYNFYGQLSGTPNAGIHFGTQPGPYTQVSAGGFYTCALMPSGAVDCWGDDTLGQATDQPGPYGAYIPDTTITSAPADPSYGGVWFTFSSDLSGATFECQMDSGGWSSCTTPKTYLVLAAGQHTFEVRAINASGDSDLTPAIVNWTVASVPPAPLGIMEASSFYTCALMPSGAIDCWGDNSFGQATDQPGPYIQVSTGNYHACALTPYGAVDCWGDNSEGQATDQPGPYTQVSAGGWHTCALTPSGAVDCWGSNSEGQAIDQPGPYTQVSAGGWHTCALTPSGAVDCWGDDYWGQATDQPGPYTQVSAGGLSTCALMLSGAVDCRGYNIKGQASDQPGPYTQVSASDWHTCALTPSGAVDCWGDNYRGQASDQPGSYTQVSAGGFYTCALMPSGTVDCWGDNSSGQATDQPGPYGPYIRPLPVLTTLSLASVAAGSGDLTLTCTGSDFVLGSSVRWNGVDLVTTYISDSQLTALIPSGGLTSLQTAQITVFTPAPGGGTSDVLPFYVTQAAANVTGQQVTSGTDPSASIEPATATATGDGLLAMAQYDANPGGTPSFSASGTYFDVFAAPGNTFTQVNIVACNLNGGNKLYWWDAGSGKWVKASPQSYDITTGCVTMAVDANSSPSLSQLQGTFFAAGTNTAPTANPGGPYLGPINTAIAFDGSLSSDPDSDTLAYAWDFGDGATGTDAVPSHSYTAAGIYDVCLMVDDGALASDPACTLAVVYDPSAGFVTGGGWIDSPAGAYLPDTTLSGKATFGFVSKYKKGVNVPQGTTEFQFDVGSFSFTSTAYQWLLVNQAGTNAQFKGSGVVNGLPDPNGNTFKFQVWASDGNPDTFRIRIWWEADGVENNVYDNGFDQEIGSGSIVVHTGK